MKCYKCNTPLSESDFCTKCGADVHVYKRILRSSEAFYNQGLTMAEARDLAGAADCLRRSVKFNKHNTKARNLLGLVYFEMGEAVAALSQWVISKSLQPEKNIASTYLDAIQKNTSRLDAINQTIKKYNQALLYAKQNNTDLAIIQLKKVLTLNPNLIKAYQLLALLYIKNKNYEKAVKPLQKALAIDKNNPLSIRYMKELKSVLGDINERPAARTRPTEKKVLPRNDDVIIPSAPYKESNAGGITVLNILIGIAVGAALMWFLVFPARESEIIQGSERERIEINNQLEQKSAVIAELEKDKADLTEQKAAIENELNAYKGKDGIINSYASMLTAIEYYLAQDYIAASDILTQIDPTAVQSDDFTRIYTAIFSEVSAKAGPVLYEQGYAAYRRENYEVANEYFQKAYNIKYLDAAVVYYLGRTYQRLGNQDKANQYFQEVLDQYPNSQFQEYAIQYKTN